MSVKIECVVPAGNELGESPCWDDQNQRLLWVDAWKARIHTWAPATGVSSFFDLPAPLDSQRIGSFALDNSGSFICAMNRDFWRFDPLTGSASFVSEGETTGGPANRLNDGKCDRKGRFWCGSFNTGDWSANTGVLYRLEEGRQAVRQFDGVGISNGIAFSPDDRIFYFADSQAGVVWQFDFDIDAGVLSNRRPFISMQHITGLVDGAAVDAEGFYWCALCKGGAIARFDPAGKLVRWIELPTRDPTMCTFGGADLDILYVTTARRFLDAGSLVRQPQAGHLLAITGLGVRGLKEPRFGS
ncbi:MAG: SMP-30/gluconolactonase/LRE family protein [Polaromonas sp.]|uniref:SMP-30/gluconolactonase/LRE family protein n=1 Tax=Polaromonas sp. TaxID=1869339 RepID=UPI0025FBB313|nr:SMP-30/gluconolactonase/LRE family protein [Polaromonas sp.]MBI2728719.1 SMP-30/gluconolactonase/LRE family protein [Polaromonas sp.]